MNTVTIFIIVEYVQKMESEFDKEKKLSKDKSYFFVLLVSKQTQKIKILKVLIINLMSKIRPQQSQKWIKLWKILVASLLF